MIAENIGPINPRFFHHLCKLNGVNLLVFSENTVPRQNNKIGLLVAYLIQKKLECFVIQVVLVRHMHIRGGKNFEIPVVNCAVIAVFGNKC